MPGKAMQLTDQTGAASDWLLGIAGPTSLVAGAAAASLFELLNSSENLPLRSTCSHAVDLTS